MKYSVYAVHDNLIGWGVPHISVNDAAEMRDFKIAMEKDPTSGDKQLYKVGTWDSEKGALLCLKENGMTAANVKLLEGRPHGENKI